MALLLAGCSDDTPRRASNETPSLEAAAIERGLVRDPGDRDLTGLYARDTDRVCVVGESDEYHIGASVDYGEGITCSATGSAVREGDRLRVTFGGDAACRFDATIEGERIAFPGQVPAGCGRFCQGTAVLSAVDVERLSAARSEAVALRDARGDALCAGGDNSLTLTSR